MCATIHGVILNADYGQSFPFITSYNFLSKTHPRFGLRRMIRSAPASLSSVLVFAFFINPIGASAINPGTQNLGPIHPHHPSSRGAFTLTSVASSTGPALPNWILPETPVAVAGFQRPQVNSVRDHRDGTSSSRRESSTGIDCETHCQPVPIRVRKQTSN